MDARTYELKTILSFERRYLVPTFQRDYEWTREGQWELLFEDIEALCTRLENSRRKAMDFGEPVNKADKTVAPHFLGAIVLDQIATPAGHLDIRSIIDGQQRLTTIQLFLRALLDVLTKEQSNRAPQIRRLIENPGDILQDPEEAYKLWPRRRDREVWRLAMSDRVDEESAHAYCEARQFFRVKIEEFAAGEELNQGRLGLMVDATMSLLKLVVIDLEDNDDAQVIFEVLNGRQMALSASDLVKNLLFMKAERAGEPNLEDAYQKYWAHFDEPWWKESMGRGHAARGRRDVLLSTWLSVNRAQEVNVRHLYSEVRSFVGESTKQVTTLLSDLCDHASAFRKVVGDGELPSASLRTSYERIERVGVTSALPLLVWLQTLPRTTISLRGLEIAVAAIESWVIRRIIVGSNTRGYAKRFVDVLGTAKNAMADGKGICLAVCATLAESHQWPEDQDIADAFRTRPMYGSLNQIRIRMILAAIDKRLQEECKKSECAYFDYENLEIEHVLPQNWRENWPVIQSNEISQHELEHRREASVDLIGNLTLVTHMLNPSMSNGPWEEKRGALREHSRLQLNREIVGYDHWHENVIDERAKTLASITCQIWRSPCTFAELASGIQS